MQPSVSSGLPRSGPSSVNFTIDSVVTAGQPELRVYHESTGYIVKPTVFVHIVRVFVMV